MEFSKRFVISCGKPPGRARSKQTEMPSPLFRYRHFQAFGILQRFQQMVEPWGKT